MAGWPSLGRVDDRRLAQELRTGDATALAQIYDVYAPRLFDYCHALLRDEDLAAEALRDSLVVALARIDGLREPERFRSWLYALVRNECLRRLRDPQTPERRHPAAEETDDAFLDAEERRRRLETRRLVHSALAGLPGRHREAVDLAVRHELAAEELAGILGISSQEALELMAESRDELDNALAAAVIARTGRGDCPSVAALVDEHEWPLPPEVSRKLVRHIASCPTCRDRRKRKVSTNRLLQMMPVAALPPGVRDAVLASAAPDLHEARTRIAQRAEPFDAWGWPTSLDHVRAGRDEERGGVPRLWPAVGAAACVLLVAGAIFLVTGGSSAQHPSGAARRPVAADTGASPSDSPSADDPGDSGSPDPTPSSATPTPTPARTSRTPTPTPTPTATSRRPSPTPSHTRRRRSPRPVPGTLVVAAQGSDEAKTITVTARGGVVHWRASAGPYVTIGGSTGGTLTPGRSATLTATADKATACTQDTPVEQSSVGFTPNGAVTLSWTC